MAARKRPRSDELIFFLVLFFPCNLLGALFYLAEASITPPVVLAPGWALFMLCFLALMNCVCAWALWEWRRWGFFGILAVSLAAFAITMMIGNGYTTVIVGFGAVTVLYFLLRPYWDEFV